jgi:DNA-binding XRE family transcriptional regulator
MENPIIHIRQHWNLNRKELAHQAGVSYMTLCNLEYGLPLSMSKKTAERICQLCEMSSDQVIDQYATWRKALKNLEN